MKGLIAAFISIVKTFANVQIEENQCEQCAFILGEDGRIVGKGFLLAGVTELDLRGWMLLFPINHGSGILHDRTSP